MNIFIYRPDKCQNAKVVPDLCYTPKGQNYREWLRDQDEAYQYKVEIIKRKLKEKRKTSHFLEDYWR
jgi:hypothetical protein